MNSLTKKLFYFSTILTIVIVSFVYLSYSASAVPNSSINNNECSQNSDCKVNACQIMACVNKDVFTEPCLNLSENKADSCLCVNNKCIGKRNSSNINSNQNKTFNLSNGRKAEIKICLKLHLKKQLKGLEN
ncbi:MAG: hypothetical protein AABW91_04545 [Nanoarchaeota archaeon]